MYMFVFIYVIVDVWDFCNINEGRVVIMEGLEWNGHYFGCLIVELSKAHWQILLFVFRSS